MTKIQLTWLSSMSALFWFLRRVFPFSTMSEVVPGQSKNDIFVAVYDLNKDTIKKCKKKHLSWWNYPVKWKCNSMGMNYKTTALLMFVVRRLHNQKVVNKVHESSNACKVKGKWLVQIQKVK